MLLVKWQWFYVDSFSLGIIKGLTFKLKIRSTTKKKIKLTVFHNILLLEIIETKFHTWKKKKKSHDDIKQSVKNMKNNDILWKK